jgi:hypothetical protein
VHVLSIRGSHLLASSEDWSRACALRSLVGEDSSYYENTLNQNTAFFAQIRPLYPCSKLREDVPQSKLRETRSALARFGAQ